MKWRKSEGLCQKCGRVVLLGSEYVGKDFANGNTSHQLSNITFTVHMKNWLPLVLGPAFAMLNTPGPTCFTANRTRQYITNASQPHSSPIYQTNATKVKPQGNEFWNAWTIRATSWVKWREHTCKVLIFKTWTIDALSSSSLQANQNQKINFHESNTLPHKSTEIISPQPPTPTPNPLLFHTQRARGPTFPLVKSPPWIIKSLMIRWKEHPL